MADIFNEGFKPVLDHVDQKNRESIAAWEERDRFADACKGSYVIDVRRLRSWNSLDKRFHPVASLKAALAEHDRADSSPGGRPPAP